GMRKKKDTRKLFLTIEGEGWSIVKQIDPRLEKQARVFAGKVTAAATRKPYVARKPSTTSEPHRPAKAGWRCEANGHLLNKNRTECPIDGSPVRWHEAT
ncbi:MAG TPA: hypothetical protein VMU55_04040, partial [Solirubrobacteraceae bacterium]|nr:hypothetical protein [Solirubrobacteraceae bacterium]